MQTTLHYFRLGCQETGGEPSSTTQGGQVEKLYMITSLDEYDLSTFNPDILGKFAAIFLHYFNKMK